jgi:hypothetical protein
MRFVSAPFIAAAFFGLPATAQATVHIDIDLASQTMHVATAQGAEYDWPVSTGRPGHRTPTGAYHPQAMYVMHHSNKYDNAPMPHAIFFHGGYAIHGTYETARLGQVASHGCVRLAPQNAAVLFEMVKHEGATIHISGRAPGRDEIARERHRGGQRLAAHWRKHYREQALAYAPPRRERTLRQWARQPLDGR